MSDVCSFSNAFSICAAEGDSVSADLWQEGELRIAQLVSLGLIIWDFLDTAH